MKLTAVSNILGVKVTHSFIERIFKSRHGSRWRVQNTSSKLRVIRAQMPSINTQAGTVIVHHLPDCVWVIPGCMLRIEASDVSIQSKHRISHIYQLTEEQQSSVSIRGGIDESRVPGTHIIIKEFSKLPLELSVLFSPLLLRHPALGLNLNSLSRPVHGVRTLPDDLAP